MSRFQVYRVTDTYNEDVLNVARKHPSSKVHYTGKNVSMTEPNLHHLYRQYKSHSTNDVLVFGAPFPGYDLEDLIIPLLSYEDHPWIYVFSDELYDKVNSGEFVLTDEMKQEARKRTSCVIHVQDALRFGNARLKPTYEELNEMLNRERQTVARLGHELDESRLNIRQCKLLVDDLNNKIKDM
jgi:hypothetical protein